ncbi:MAG: superoxide dismutase family protein [Clostridiales bacterium]|jgi:Cu-Zn family superoxide dismutase|nr:superoxide dismutase family protein [Clostridiales bacterium]
MEQSGTAYFIRQIRCRRPDAVAIVSGSDKYPDLHGLISFCQTDMGVIVTSEVWGLPDPEENCVKPVFAMHIHSGTSCTGNAEDPFADAGQHYNPGGCEHPSHAGDLPPLFSNNGMAWSSVLTNRFTVQSVLGKTVIIHRQPDDFTTQPSGNSGAKIACGVIRIMR